MTHDELMAKIDEGKNSQNLQFSDWYALTYNGKNSVNANANALRAVVELHKDNGYGSCDICADPNTGHLGVMALYPCPTIQAIEEQLK